MFINFCKFIFNKRKINNLLLLLAQGRVISIIKLVQHNVHILSLNSKKKSPRVDLKVNQINNGEVLIAVVIPCFNYGAYILDAIESILKQTIPNVPVIIVDGGSTDHSTIKVLKSIKLPNVRVFFRDGLHYVGDNRNYGIKIVNARYVCCLDADDILDPTYLEKALFYLETYGYDIASTSIKYIGLREGHSLSPKYITLRDIVESNGILTCAVFRKSIWNTVGGYYDSGVGINHTAEDWDFWIKCLIAGARVRNINREFLFNYRIHDSGSLSNNPAVMSLEMQRQKILKRHNTSITKSLRKKSHEEFLKNYWADPKNNSLCQWVESNVELNNCIIIVLPFLIVGGVERLLSSFSNYLVSKKWRVVIVSTNEQNNESGSSKDWFSHATTEIYQLPLFLDEDEYMDFFDYLIKSRSPDCILNVGSEFFYKHVKLITDNYSSLCLIDYLFNTVGHVKNHLLFKSYFSFAFAESLEVYDWYINSAGWNSEKLKLLKSGVDTSVLNPVRKNDSIRKKLNISDDELLVGFSGRLSEEKGPDIFVEIAKLSSNIKLHFVMTGGGPLEKLIIQKTKELDSKVKFHFVGLVDHVHDYISSYDLLVLPSRADGRPLVVLEALALGVPVIASKVGALPELISDGENGFLVESLDAKAFIDLIDNIASENDLLNAMKVKARAYAEKYLDGDNAFKIYEEALLVAIDSATKCC
jgi:glycosyltransferase involved in cell wall biosynthesis